MKENRVVGSYPEQEEKYKLGSISEVRDVLGTSIPFLDSKHPHVAKNLAIFWGRIEFYEHMHNLLMYSATPDRPTREGFSDDVIQELMLISKLHDSLFPELSVAAFRWQ